MVHVCIVKSCKSGRNNKQKGKSCSVSFFQPTTPTRLQRWSQSLGIALKRSDYICQFHFKKKDIKMYDKIVIGNEVHLHYSGRKTLSIGALPTIEHQFQFIPKPKQQKSGQPKREQKQQQPARPKPEKELILQIVKPITYLKQKIAVLPQHWLYVERPNKIEFMRLDPESKQIKNHIVLNEDFSITVICLNDEKISLDEKLSSPDEIFGYLKYVEKWPLCVGTQIENRRYSKRCKGVIVGEEAYKRNQMNPRCKSCRVLRSQLQSHNCTANKTLNKKSVALKLHFENTKYCQCPKTGALFGENPTREFFFLYLSAPVDHHYNYNEATTIEAVQYDYISPKLLNNIQM